MRETVMISEESESGAVADVDGSLIATRSGIGPRMPAVRNSISLLRRLAGSARPLSAAALARALNMPRSSIYQMLQVLIDEGLVTHVPEDRTYTLGVGVFELGSAYLRHQPLEHLARPLLVKLAQKLGETAQLGILQGNETLYLLKEQPLHFTALVTEIGVRLPAHLTASGRSMLAGLPAKQVLAFFSGPASFPSLTGIGPSSIRTLMQVVREDQQRGWSVEEGNVTEGISCIAAAVRDQSGRPVASIVTSFTTTRHVGEYEAIAKEIVHAANELTHRLGGSVALSLRA